MNSRSGTQPSVRLTQTKPPYADLALHFAHRRVFLAEALLVALLGARDVDAVAARVERPLVEDAGQALGVARRVVQDGVAAVRADVVERAHFVVVAADHDQRHAGRMAEKPVVVGPRHLRLVAGDDPRRPEQLLLLLLEDLLVGVDARIDVVRLRKLRLRFPLGGGFGHANLSFSEILGRAGPPRQDAERLSSSAFPYDVRGGALRLTCN